MCSDLPHESKASHELAIIEEKEILTELFSTPFKSKVKGVSNKKS